jgi:hypothetical protein
LPLRLSLPEPAPGPPLTVSFPGPALTRSSPARPSMLSLPFMAVILSAPCGAVQVGVIAVGPQGGCGRMAVWPNVSQVS